MTLTAEEKAAHWRGVINEKLEALLFVMNSAVESGIIPQFKLGNPSGGEFIVESLDLMVKL